MKDTRWKITKELNVCHESIKLENVKREKFNSLMAKIPEKLKNSSQSLVLRNPFSANRTQT